jgi:hypothetical protein
MRLFPGDSPWRTRAVLGTLCAAGSLVIVGCSPDEVNQPEPPIGPQVPISATVAPTSGLIGEWKLDETSGTTAFDTKNGYNATVSGGAAFVPGKLGNGLDLNNGTAGTGTKYAQMPSNAVLDAVQEGNYTISAWFYPYSTPPNLSSADQHWAIVSKAGWHMGLVYSPGNRFAVRHYLSGNVLKGPTSTGTYALNTWHHVAGVVSKTAGTVTLYVNGSVGGSVTFPADSAAREYGTTPFRIGKGSSNWAANGKVDQVRIYNRVLSAAEVSDLYNETTGAAPTVTTKVASAIGTTTATLNGSADPNGASTTGWFRYWTADPGSCTDNGGVRAPATGGTALGSGTSAVSYSRGITGLTIGTIYYFCAIASNSAGIRYGQIRYFVPVRFAVGMFKQQMSDLGLQWSPDAKISWTGGNVPEILADAKAAGARIFMHVTRDNGHYTNTDGTFNIARWKTDFDLVAAYGNAIRPYVKDGTLLGHYAIDEPYIDFENFQVADLEEMCRYQKLSWPFVPCVVRINPAILDSVKPTGGYRYVDAGWATLTDFQYDNPMFNGDFKAWYDTNLVAARRSGLGVIYGYNLLNGGHEETPAPGGCVDQPPPDQQTNCGMSADEIRKIATAISALGHDQACAVYGWGLYKDPGPQRDYFFGTGNYAGNGMQSAMQELWNKTAGAGLRPAPCNVRGDLPAP